MPSPPHNALGPPARALYPYLPPHTDVNACISYLCKTNGAGGTTKCTDVPNPAPNCTLGRTCMCTTNTSYYANETAGCADIDACESCSCNQTGLGGNATCKDIVGAANSIVGRTCTCANGAAYTDATGCPVLGECILDSGWITKM